MRLYAEVGRRAFRRYAAYRSATLAGIFTNVVFGFLRTYVLVAVVRGSGGVGGYDVADTITFTWVGQGMLTVVHLWGWEDVADRFRTGDIAHDLSKPYDFQGFWLAHDYGRALYHLLTRGIGPWVVGAIAFTLRAPHHPATYAAFAVSLTLAVTVSFAYRFLLNIAVFWVHDAGGVFAIGQVLALFFCGLTVPIPFFPGWLRAVATVTPWAAMLQTPIDVFLEQRNGAALAGMLALQFGWAVALLGAGRFLLRRARHRLVVQGG